MSVIAATQPRTLNLSRPIAQSNSNEEKLILEQRIIAPLKSSLKNVKTKLDYHDPRIARNYNRMLRRVNANNLNSYLPEDVQSLPFATLKNNLVRLLARLVRIYHEQKTIEESIKELGVLAIRLHQVNIIHHFPEVSSLVLEIIDFTKEIDKGQGEEGGYKRTISNMNNIARITSAVRKQVNIEEVKHVVHQWRLYADYPRRFDEEALLEFNKHFREQVIKMLNRAEKLEKTLGLVVFKKNFRNSFQSIKNFFLQLFRRS